MKDYDQQRIENAILYLLKRANEKKVNNLSRFQIMKLLYLIDIEYRRFLGISFYKTASFTRWDRGPLLIEAYPILDELYAKKIINIVGRKILGYNKERLCHSLNKLNVRINLTNAEKVFLNSIIDSYIDLNLNKLKELVYSTEPMKEILQREKVNNNILKEKLNMNLVKKI